MELQYSIYLLSLFAVAMLTAGLAIYAWLSLAGGLSVISQTPEAARFWNDLRYVGLAGIPVLDNQGRVVDANPALSRLVGCDPTHAIGQGQNCDSLPLVCC